MVRVALWADVGVSVESLRPSSVSKHNTALQDFVGSSWTSASHGAGYSLQNNGDGRGPCDIQPYRWSMQRGEGGYRPVQVRKHAAMCCKFTQSPQLHDSV